VSAAGLWECRRHVHVVAEACSACPPWRAKAFGVGDLGWHKMLPHISPPRMLSGLQQKQNGLVRQLPDQPV
jgi:hypothetical protein